MAGGGGDPGGGVSRAKSPFETMMPRRSLQDDAHFDITAMIDLVFMMNIFFLVTSLTKSAAEVDLPQAHYCVPANEVDCVVILVRTGKSADNPDVSILNDASAGATIPAAELEDRIKSAMELGVGQKKNKVLVKAEKTVLIGQIVRITALATAVEGVEPLFAVMELDKEGGGAGSK